MTKIVRTAPVLPIPVMTAGQLAERRIVKHEPSLVDRVERAISDVLIANEAYLRLVAGISRANSAEGTIMDDNVLAAKMVREAEVDLVTKLLLRKRHRLSGEHRASHCVVSISAARNGQRPSHAAKVRPSSRPSATALIIAPTLPSKEKGDGFGRPPLFTRRRDHDHKNYPRRATQSRLRSADTAPKTAHRNPNLCVHLAQARTTFSNDRDFGAWLKQNDLDALNDHDRAAAIAMGQQPKAAKTVLEKTERRSLQLIPSRGVLDVC